MKINKYVVYQLFTIIAILFAFLPKISYANETINVGMNVAWPPDVMLALAQAKGLIPKGYDVNVKILQHPMTAYSLLASGKLDVLDSTEGYIPVAVSKNIPIVAVWMDDLSYGADKIVTRRKVTSPSQIKNQSVAAPQAYLGELLMGLWLHQIGVKPSQVNWVDLNAPDAVGPIMSGKVEAAYLYSPWVSKVVTNLKDANVAASSAQKKYLKTAMLGDVTYMNRNFIQSHRKAAEVLLKARFKAVQYWHDHTKAANKYIAHYLNWSISDVRAIIGTNGKYKKGGLYIFDFNQAAKYCGVLHGALPFGIKNGQWKETVNRTNHWWIKLGLLKHMHNPSKGIDCSLISDVANKGFSQSMHAK